MSSQAKDSSPNKVVTASSANKGKSTLPIKTTAPSTDASKAKTSSSVTSTTSSSAGSSRSPSKKPTEQASSSPKLANSLHKNMSPAKSGKDSPKVESKSKATEVKMDPKSKSPSPVVSVKSSTDSPKAAKGKTDSPSSTGKSPSKKELAESVKKPIEIKEITGSGSKITPKKSVETGKTSGNFVLNDSTKNTQKIPNVGGELKQNKGVTSSSVKESASVVKPAETSKNTTNSPVKPAQVKSSSAIEAKTMSSKVSDGSSVAVSQAKVVADVKKPKGKESVSDSGMISDDKYCSASALDSQPKKQENSSIIIGKPVQSKESINASTKPPAVSKETTISPKSKLDKVTIVPVTKSSTSGNETTKSTESIPSSKILVLQSKPTQIRETADISQEQNSGNSTSKFPIDAKEVISATGTSGEYRDSGNTPGKITHVVKPLQMTETTGKPPLPQVSKSLSAAGSPQTPKTFESQPSSTLSTTTTSAASSTTASISDFNKSTLTSLPPTDYPSKYTSRSRRPPPPKLTRQHSLAAMLGLVKNKEMKESQKKEIWPPVYEEEEGTNGSGERSHSMTYMLNQPTNVSALRYPPPLPTYYRRSSCTGDLPGGLLLPPPRVSGVIRRKPTPTLQPVDKRRCSLTLPYATLYGSWQMSAATTPTAMELTSSHASPVQPQTSLHTSVLINSSYGENQDGTHKAKGTFATTPLISPSALERGEGDGTKRIPSSSSKATDTAAPNSSSANNFPLSASIVSHPYQYWQYPQLMASFLQKVPMKDFGSEVRASLDIAHFLQSAVLALDVQDTTLDGITDLLLSKVLGENNDEPTCSMAEAKSILFTTDTGEYP